MIIGMGELYAANKLLKIVDTITVNGPYKTDNYGIMLQSPVFKNPVKWPLPQCGTGTIKYKTELSIKAKNGAKGSVSSEVVKYQGKEETYGVQQGLSYDFEKCKK
jgi:hypothetical protein